MVTILIVLALTALTIRLFGLRLMPLALVAATVGLAVNVFGVLPVPQNPLAAAADDLRQTGKAHSKALSCRLAANEALTTQDPGDLTAAELTCREAARLRSIERDGRPDTQAEAPPGAPVTQID